MLSDDRRNHVRRIRISGIQADGAGKSETYMKTVVAFANGSGGRIVFGVENGTLNVVGVDQENAFSLMDGITSAICDSCAPMITPIVALASVEEKVVIVVNIMPGGQRPYYLTSKGKEKGTYIRVSGTTRPADSFVLKELEFEGANRCFDQTYAAPEESVTEDEINLLCNRMYQYAVEHCRSQEAIEGIHHLTRQNLLSWGILPYQCVSAYDKQLASSGNNPMCCIQGER